MPIFWTQRKFLDALTNGDRKTVEAFLARDSKWAQTRWRKINGKSALHIAAASGSAAVVKLLLDAGASPNLYDREYATPFHYAMAGGHEEVARSLIAAGADAYVNSSAGSNRTPVQHAIALNSVPLLKMLLDTKKVDLNAGEDPPVYFAVLQQSRECLETLLAAGADPNVPHHETRSSYDYDDYWPGRGRTENYKRSPLDCACALGDMEAAKMLLKAGAKPLENEYPLHTVVESGNVKFAALLISYGFDPSQKNDQGCTTLHRVLSARPAEGLEEMVQFLLAQGVNRAVKDKDGGTALSYAQRYAQKNIIDLLQGPLPAVTPVRTVVMPAPKEPLTEVAPPPPQMPALSRVDEDDAWTLSGNSRVVHTTMFPTLGRRLTEIFNFETRERVSIAENLALKIETMGPHESFDTITDAALTKALGEFRRLGGKADEASVLGNRMMKMKVKP